ARWLRTASSLRHRGRLAPPRRHPEPWVPPGRRAAGRTAGIRNIPGPAGPVTAGPPAPVWGGRAGPAGGAGPPRARPAARVAEGERRAVVADAGSTGRRVHRMGGLSDAAVRCGPGEAVGDAVVVVLGPAVHVDVVVVVGVTGAEQAAEAVVAGLLRDPAQRRRA